MPRSCSHARRPCASVREPLWTTDVQDNRGIASGTAFDFLGDGDEVNLFVFDGLSAPLMQVPHSSATYIEYPTVADVDNDGSAEILVVTRRSR